MLVSANQGATLRVGILRTSSIGDVVLASACLHVLEQLPFPVEAIWIGRSPTLDLLQQAYPALHGLSLEQETPIAEIIQQLNGVHFLVDLQGNLRSRFLSRAFKKAYGKPNYLCPKSQFQRNRLILEGRMVGRRRLLSDRALHPEKNQFQTMVQTLRTGLLRQLPAAQHKMVEALQGVPTLPFPPRPLGDTPWEQALSTGPWLAVAPGASFATKRAPASLFIQVLADFQRKASPIGLVFVGDSHDRLIAQEISDALQWKGPWLNLAGELSLAQSAWVLEKSRVLLSNDSSLGHIAEACGIPVAILFGPTVEGFGFAPHLPSSRAFSVPLGCRPCSKHGKVPCRFGDHLCFTQLPAPEIATFLQEKFPSASGEQP